MEALLCVVENTAGDCTKADEAERHVIEELRKMGSDALHCWAEKAAKKTAEALREQQPGLHGDGKKSLLAYDLWNNHDHGAYVSFHRPTD